MSSEMNQTLQQAYDLIEADDLAGARSLLEPLLGNQQDPDVWWLYAHATDDPAQGREALYRVIALDPNYPGAAEMMQAMEAAADAIQPAPRMVVAPPAPVSVPEADVTAYTPVTTVTEPVQPMSATQSAPPPPETRRSGIGFLPIALVIAALLAVAAIVLIPAAVDDSTAPTIAPEVAIGLTQTVIVGIVISPEPTVADNTDVPDIILTVEPTLDSIVEATAEALAEATPEVTVELIAEITPEATATVSEDAETDEPDFESLAVTLRDAGFTLGDTEIDLRETSLGDTVVAAVCSQAGPTLRQQIPVVMTTLALAFAESADAESEAIGVDMRDCTTDTALTYLVVDVETARAFAAGDITEQAFQSAVRRN